GIGEWCERVGVDAWYRAAPTLVVATSEAQLDASEHAIEACEALGAPEEIRRLKADELRARCDAGFLGGAILRTSATVQPARLAVGLRAKVVEAGVRLHERTPVRRLRADDVVVTPRGRVRAGAAVLAVNSATAGFPGFRLAHAVSSSHIVLTEPVPDVLEELGWTGGEPIADGRTLLHYLRTTRDGRIAFGWGGGRMGFGARRLGRLDVDPGAARTARDDLLRFFPQIRGRLALDRRDHLTRLALVDPERKLMPPEPLRWAGGSLIRSALVRADRAE